MLPQEWPSVTQQAELAKKLEILLYNTRLFNTLQ